ALPMLEVKLCPQAVNVGDAAAESCVREICTDVVELQLGVRVQIPVEAGRKVEQPAPLDVLAVEVDVRAASGKLPGPQAVAFTGRVLDEIVQDLDAIDGPRLLDIRAVLAGQKVSHRGIKSGKVGAHAGGARRRQNHAFRLHREGTFDP